MVVGKRFLKMEIGILIYTKENLKQSGEFKKNFVKKWITKTEFFKYLKDNDFKIDSDYFDITGTIINQEKRFRASYNNMIIGTSKIVEEFNNGK